MAKFRTLRVFENTLLAALWMSTFGVALAWVFRWELPFEAEPVTVLLGLVSTAVTALVTQLSRLVKVREEELETEKYSTPFALAYGYVNNFIEPTITRLLDRGEPDTSTVKLYIYIPEELSELEAPAVDRTLARVRSRQYRTEVIKLDLEKGRARDVITIMKGTGGRPIYFDFPNTLLTLRSLVDYKIESRKDSFPDKSKRELGLMYIQKFRKAVEEMLAQKGIGEYVTFTDKQLTFLETGADQKPPS